MTTVDATALDPGSVRAAARAIQSEVVAIRRRIHRHPEVGNLLPITQAVVMEELARIGLEGRPGASLSSVVAVVAGGRPGPTVLLRADMDALPLDEDTGLDFASEAAGAMHACGHDAHVAMLLGAARLLQDRRASWPGRVVLMFQPGEEGMAGATTMLEEGLLGAAGPDAPPPTGAFAIHLTTRFPSGEIHLRPGPIFAASDVVRIVVRGRGGHASAPHLALDPIPIAAEIVLALQAMATRRIDAAEPSVVTIGQISGGTANNIIPETVFLHGTTRTVSAETRERVREGVRRVAEGVAAAHGATVEVDLEPSYPATINDAGFVGLVREAAAEVLGPERVVEMPTPLMSAEDFSYVIEQVPGAEVFLGACPPGLDPATAPQFHSNRFVMDEDVMSAGVALHAAVALRHLHGAGHP